MGGAGSMGAVVTVKSTILPPPHLSAPRVAIGSRDCQIILRHLLKPCRNSPIAAPSQTVLGLKTKSGGPPLPTRPSCHVSEGGSSLFASPIHTSSVLCPTRRANAMTAAKDPDFYAVLGVPRTATETEARHSPALFL